MTYFLMTALMAGIIFRCKEFDNCSLFQNLIFIIIANLTLHMYEIVARICKLVQLREM